MTTKRRRCQSCYLLFAALVVIIAAGCDNRPEVVSASGRVTYNGAPLKFGVVMLQPVQGQVAQGTIAADGSFIVSTFEQHDGAVPGHYQVSVLCYEAHDPNGPGAKEDEGGGIWMGKPLVPLKYTRASSSGLAVEIPVEGTDQLLIELTGRVAP